jgi:hypothetical protein
MQLGRLILRMNFVANAFPKIIVILAKHSQVLEGKSNLHRFSAIINTGL